MSSANVAASSPRTASGARPISSPAIAASQDGSRHITRVSTLVEEIVYILPLESYLFRPPSKSRRTGYQYEFSCQPSPRPVCVIREIIAVRVGLVAGALACVGHIARGANLSSKPLSVR